MINELIHWNKGQCLEGTLLNEILCALRTIVRLCKFQHVSTHKKNRLNLLLNSHELHLRFLETALLQRITCLPYASVKPKSISCEMENPNS